MLIAASRYWWIAIVRGVFAILFGIFAFMRPDITLAALVLYFGAWALVTGILGVFEFFFAYKKHESRILQLVAGLLSIALGLMTFARPDVTALVLIIYIAVWAFMQGLFEIAAAVKLYGLVPGAWMLMLSGIASVIFSLIILWNPLPGALALLWIIAAYAIIFGFLAIGFGIHMRRVAKQLGTPTV